VPRHPFPQPTSYPEKIMLQTDSLDLTAQDVTEPAWDELIRAMLDEQQALPGVGRSCTSGFGECDSIAPSCNSCGCGGCHHIT
jgi:hypothetical protein